MFVLGSASPRRRELLTQIGLTFEVHTADIDEVPRLAEDAFAYVQRLAEHKAAAIWARLGSHLPDPHRLTVLGADTTVLCGGLILGKPTDEQDAARMLRLLSGRAHQVLTGLVLVTAIARQIAVETTTVYMDPLTSDQIGAYIATGEPMGKAGAYAIQGHAARFIPRIEGCYFNVVGLPLARLSAMLGAIR